MSNTRLIAAPNYQANLVKQNYNTGDIVREVLDTYRDNKQQLQAFAQTLKGANDYDTCKKIFDFIKQNIHYQVDPAGVQWAKTPARLWADKVGDCKSFSIFAASCLHCLNIPGCFRFVSFSADATPTHVYVVAYSAAKEIVIDAVIERFKTQKKYTEKIDYDMNSLYRLSGIASALAPGKLTVADPIYKKGKPVYNPAPGEFELPVSPDGTTTDELIEAALLKQRLEIERAINARVAGIGSTADVYAAQAIRDLDARIKAAVSGVEDVAVGGFFKKVFNGIKKVVLAPVKLAAKVVLAPVALILNKELPKSAMSWMYIFLTDEMANKLPAVVQKKRQKQLKMMKAITSIIFIKEKHFRELVQNGIMKKTGKTPLAFMSEQFKMKLAGVGFVMIKNPIPNGVKVRPQQQQPAGPSGQLSNSLIATGNPYAAAAGILMKVINAIVALFKKKSKDLPQNEQEALEAVPNPSDFDSADPNAVNVLYQAAASQPSKIEQVLATAGAAVQTVQEAVQTFKEANGMPPADNTNYGTGGNYGNNNLANQYDQNTLPDAVVTPASGAAATTGDKSKLLLYGGLGIAALFVVSTMSRKK